MVDLHEPADTTGQSLSNMLLEVLSGLSLSTENLRGQSYDGAANMAGIYNGCLAFIRNSQPLAEYFHCSAHCANSVARAINCELLRDFFVNLNELGVLIQRSIKFRDIIGQNSCFDHMIRPICPTHWLCRNENIRRLLGQYPSILSVLEEMSSLNLSGPAYKVAILKKYFIQGQAFLAAKIAQKVFDILEELNVIVQRRSMSVCEMVEAVNIVNARLETL